MSSIFGFHFRFFRRWSYWTVFFRDRARLHPLKLDYRTRSFRRNRSLLKSAPEIT